jgi:hypothetical protein
LSRQSPNLAFLAAASFFNQPSQCDAVQYFRYSQPYPLAMYILYDAEKPSVFIKEVSANKDCKYQFNQISTEGVKSAPPDYGSCPSCGTGKVTIRVMTDGRFFFGCDHYPYCGYTAKTCNLCNKFPMIKAGLEFRCQNP